MTEHALRKAAEYGGPVLVHAITRKGFGYPLAEQNEEDCLHQVPGTRGQARRAPPRPPRQAGRAQARRGATCSPTRWSRSAPAAPTWSAITAAMLHPVGLAPFKAAYPDRVYDVGIAEQHAMTMAAGLAMAGLHPVVVGVRDVPEPGLRPAADGRGAAQAAGHRDPGPGRRHRPRRRAATTACGTARSCRSSPGCGSPRRATAAASPSCSTRRSRSATAPPWSAGPRAASAPRPRRSASSARWTSWPCPADGLRPGRAAARRRPDGRHLRRGGAPAGRTTASASPSSTRAGSSRSTRPSSRRPAQHRLVAVVEDNGRAGGFGDAVARLLRDHDVDVPVKTFGLPQEFLDHGVARRDPRGGRADPAAPGAPAHRGGRPPHARPAAPGRRRADAPARASTPERLPE